MTVLAKQLVAGLSQDDDMTYEIWGTLVQKVEAPSLEKELSCFHGAGYTHCKHEWADSTLGINDPAADARVKTVHHTEYFQDGEPFCIECCSDARLSYDFNATWKLVCDTSPLPVDASTAKDTALIYRTVDGNDPRLDQRTRQVPYEFRFAKRSTVDDPDVVKCDLDREINSTVPMYGYWVDISLTEYTDGVRYWRGVNWCKAHALESIMPPISGSKFVEHINLIVGGANDCTRAALVFSLFLVATHMAAQVV